MYYEGISECVQRANDVDKWWIGDYSKGKYIQDPTVKVKCDNQGNFESFTFRFPCSFYIHNLFLINNLKYCDLQMKINM